MTTSKRRRSSSSNPPTPPAEPRVESLMSEKPLTAATIKPISPHRQPLPEVERMGSILRRVREQRGEQLENISDYLRIRREYLVALENSRYDELPADAYVIGFLRTYANYLGLEGKGAIDQYRREMAGRRRKPQLVLPQPITEGRAPTAVILIGATIAVMLIYALWYGLSSSERAVVTTPPAMPQTGSYKQPNAIALEAPAPPAAAASITPTVIPTVAAATVVAPPPVTLAATTDKTDKNETVKNEAAPGRPQGQVYGDPVSRSRVIIRVDKQSWVLVADSQGNTVFDHIMKPGDTYKLPNRQGLTLTTGNGGGIILSLDGVDLPRFAEEGRVVRNISLNPDELKSNTPAAD